MGHMVTVEEAKGKRKQVRGKAYFSVPANFFQVSRVKAENVLYCSGS